MSARTAHKWTFRPRFKAKAFGWRSSLPIKRIKETVSEIRQVARKDKCLGAEGAVILLERLSPAIAQVDSSSGAIGNAVYNAIETLVPIIVTAPASDKLRDQWLERLWVAIEQDEMPYLETLSDHWGDLCVTAARASMWADRFIDMVRLIWSPDMPPGGYFKGTPVCLSSLFAAGRHDELLDLLELAPYRLWHNRQWGVKALAAQGERAAAIQYAEETRGLNQSNIQISLACEDICCPVARGAKPMTDTPSKPTARAPIWRHFGPLKGSIPRLTRTSLFVIWPTAHPATKANGLPQPSQPGCMQKRLRSPIKVPAIREH